jgi:type I restriction enzyme S subunit
MVYLNVVPEGWTAQKLIDCGIGGISNGVFCDPKKVGSGYKLINVYEMYQGYGVDVNLTRRLQLNQKEFERNKVNYGDVFFTRSSLKLEGIAYCNINLSHDDDITYDGHLMRIVPNRDVVTPDYLARFCLSDVARRYLMSTAKHSTMTTIAQADIAPLPVLLPPLPEQQKIAVILTSVDEVIEKTQAQIDKLKDLKTAMMQELLSPREDSSQGNGVGTKQGDAALSNSLRMSHIEFKDSPVGRIPKSWEVGSLKSFTERVCVGFVGTCEKFYRSNGIPMIRTGNLKKGILDLSALKYVTKEFHDSQKKSQLKAGDLLIARHGNHGSACIVPSDLGDANCLNVVIVKVDLANYIPEFLKYMFNSDLMMDMFASKSEGSTQKVISTTEIANSIFLKPTLEEQNTIVSILFSIDNKLELTKTKNKVLLNIKKALMQDLLTGKVRVKVD